MLLDESSPNLIGHKDFLRRLCELLLSRLGFDDFGSHSSSLLVIVHNNLYFTISLGHVGIGTTSPGGALHIAPPIGAAAWSYFQSNTGFAPNTSIWGLALGANRSGGSSEINLVNNTTPGDGFYFDQSNGAGTYTRLVTMKGSGNVGIATTSPAATLDVVGNARISGGLGDIIYSTQPANRYFAPGTGWYYTGEYLTITVPTGPARRYRITNRQMVTQSSTGNIIMALRTINTSDGPTLYYPYHPVVGGYWSTVNADTYVTINGGTTATYYVWMYFSSAGGAVASENRGYCDLFAVQM